MYIYNISVYFNIDSYEDYFEASKEKFINMNVRNIIILLSSTIYVVISIV